MKMRGIRNPKIWLVMSVIILGLIDIATAVDRYVPSQYPTIQAAIDAAVNGDTVVVAPGIYTGDGNRDIDFKGKAITVCSTDPDDPSIVAATVIDCQGSSSDPHRGFYFHSGEGGNSVVSGFTITNGYAPRDVRWVSTMVWAGGAILCDGASPTISYCTIVNNWSGWSGGGIFCRDSSLTITHCAVIDNTADFYGGGIFCYRGNPRVIYSIISGNSTKEFHGGGIYCHYDTIPTIRHCAVTGNSTGGRGGGVYYRRGNPTISHCTIASNSADNYTGGGIHCWENCNLTVSHCILWDNTSKNNSQVSLSDKCYMYIFYSDLQDAQAAIYLEDSTLGWGEGNIDAYPCFVRPGYSGPRWRIEGDYHLLPDSPCINAGDPNFITEPNETDMDGELRVMLGRVDMGADEFNPFEVSFDVVSKRRISRTVFEYECNVSLSNIWRFAVRNVQLEIVKAPENMVIIDPDVTFGDVEIGPGESATSIDTCTFQVDRSKAIEPAKIIWWSTSEVADTGQTLQHNGSSVVFLELEKITGDITGEGRIDFEDLARLAGQWLLVGPAGSIPEDITGDGIINLRDFAVLAERWLEGKP
jgi:predicted outer membrane repeat protein